MVRMQSYKEDAKIACKGTKKQKVVQYVKNSFQRNISVKKVWKQNDSQRKCNNCGDAKTKKQCIQCKENLTEVEYTFWMWQYGEQHKCKECSAVK